MRQQEASICIARRSIGLHLCPSNSPLDLAHAGKDRGEHAEGFNLYLEGWSVDSRLGMAITLRHAWWQNRRSDPQTTSLIWVWSSSTPGNPVVRLPICYLWPVESLDQWSQLIKEMALLWRAIAANCIDLLNMVSKLDSIKYRITMICDMLNNHISIDIKSIDNFEPPTLHLLVQEWATHGYHSHPTYWFVRGSALRWADR